MKTSLLPNVIRQLVLPVFTVLFVFSLTARDIVVKENGGTGIDIKVNTYENLNFTASLDLIHSYKISTEAGMFTELVIPGYSSTLIPGLPKLPVNRELIEFPFGATAVINILNYQVREFDLADLGIHELLIPAQPSVPKDGSYVPFEFDASAYARDAFTDDDLVSVEVLGIMRGLRIASLNISPVQYNPVSGKIRVYSDIEVEITFQGADVITTLNNKRKNESPYFRSVGASLLNYKVEQAANRDTITKYPVKFVIVSDRMFESQLQPYIEWKTKKGFTVVEAYTDEPGVGSTTNSIKLYLEGLYNAGTASDPAPSFVLFENKRVFGIFTSS
jgi:hypothetical protein